MPGADDLRAACDLATSPDRLHAIAQGSDRALHEAVAANPSARRESVDRMLARAAGLDADAYLAALAEATLRNPSAPVWLLLDPAWLASQPDAVARELARSPALTSLFWTALSRHPEASVRLRLLRSPAAPPDAWTQSGLLSAGGLTFDRQRLTHDDLCVLLAAPCPLAATLLDLSRNHLVTDETFAALARSDRLPNLRKLEAHGTSLGPDGLGALAASTTLASLEWLDLGNTGVDDDGAVALACSAAFPRLQHLDLSADIKKTRRAVGDAGALALAQSTTLGQLRTLCLAGSSVSDVGAQSLAFSRAFPRLEWLDLSDLDLGDIGLRALAASPLLATLFGLDVNGCREVPAREALREAAARHPGLELRM